MKVKIFKHYEGTDVIERDINTFMCNVNVKFVSALVQPGVNGTSCVVHSIFYEDK